MSLVVDASVALKWVVEEDGSNAARTLVADEPLFAPDLLFIECANALRTKVRFGQLDGELARGALAALLDMPIRVVPSHPNVAAALSIAGELNRSAYDSLYLAVALAERAILVTADEKFASAVRAHPVYRDSLRPLLG